MTDTTASVKEAPKEDSSVISFDKAYIHPEEKILDPDKLEDSALDRLPKPTGWRRPFCGTSGVQGYRKVS